jgi:hypothetical protein
METADTSDVIAGVLAKRAQSDPFSFVGHSNLPVPVMVKPEPVVEVGGAIDLTLSIIPADDGSDDITELEEDMELKIGEQLYELNSSTAGATVFEFRVNVTRVA